MPRQLARLSRTSVCLSLPLALAAYHTSTGPGRGSGGCLPGCTGPVVHHQLPRTHWVLGPPLTAPGPRRPPHLEVWDMLYNIHIM